MLIFFATQPPTQQPQNTQFDLLSVIIGPLLVGLVCALIGAYAGYLFSQRDRVRKEITYQIRNNSPLIISKEIKNRIEIYLDKKLITQELSLVAIKITNTGNVSIEVKDYIHPISFKFEGRKVEDANVADFIPKSLLTLADIETFRDTNIALRQKDPISLVLPNFHLNSRKGAGELNSYTVQVLLTGPKGIKDIKRNSGTINDGRIRESDQVTNDSPSIQGILRRTESVLVTLLFLIATMLVTFGINLLTTTPPSIFIGSLTVILGGLIYIVVAFAVTFSIFRVSQSP